MGPDTSPSPSPIPNAARTLTSHSRGAMASSAAAVSIAVTRAALGCGARTRSDVARDENATLPTSSSPSMVTARARGTFRGLYNTARKFGSFYLPLVCEVQRFFVSLAARSCSGVLVFNIPCKSLSSRLTAHAPILHAEDLVLKTELKTKAGDQSTRRPNA